MILIGVNEVKKAYVTEDILRDVTFNIQTGDKIGLIGVNGAGKTTLVDIINEELYIDAGEIYKQKDLKIGYLKQSADLDLSENLFDECLKVFSNVIKLEKKIRDLEIEMASISEKDLEDTLNKYQNLQDRFNNLHGYEYNSRIQGVLRGLGFSEEEFKMSIKYFSGGQKSRAQLAKLLLATPDILFLDEPTNHLDLEAIEFLQGFLRDYTGAVVIISHDRYFLDKIVNKILLLENKKVETYNCGYEKYTKQRQKDLEMRISAYENQQKEISRQQEIIDKFANYGSARLIKQSQSRRKLLDKMKVLDAPVTVSGKFSLKFSPAVESGKDVLQVDNASKQFDSEPLFKNVNIDIYKGEKVGLIGPNGIGKTTLFKMILGKTGINEGTIRLGSQVKVGYYDQEQKNLDESNTIIDEIWNSYPKLTHYDIRNFLARFLFVGDDIFKEISELSGGEKARISLLKLMLSSTNFLLMDEPTNHLDIDSKEVLESALNDYQGTCFIISHDRYFLNKVLDKIIVLDETGTVTYLGNYDYYIEKLNEAKEPVKEIEVSKTQITKDKKKQKELEKEKSKKDKEIKALEQNIEIMEEELAILNDIVSDSSIYENQKKMVEVFKEIEEKEKKKNELYEKWIELQE